MAGHYPFGKLLTSVRKEQGYATPYAFYRSRGGQRGLGLTFANYLSLERGRSLPKGWRLKKLLTALELMPHSPRTKELVYCYLAGVLGSEDLLRDLISEAAPDPAPGSWKLAESAASQALGRTKVQLDMEQYGALSRDAVAYACHVVLCNTAGWVDASDLSEMTGAEVAAVKKSLKGLKAVKLVKYSGSKARSTLEKNYVAPPAPTAAMASVYAALKKHRSAWIERRGLAIHAPYLLLRAKRSQMQRYLEHLSEVVNMSALYGDIDRTPDSEIFLVEGRVVRLFNLARA